MLDYRRIKDFPDYVICNNGGVYSLLSNKWITGGADKNGYMRIGLRNNEGKKTIKIHRLLGIHFIDNPDNKPFIDHINRIKSDNRLENLRWATPSENSLNTGLCPRSKTGHKNIFEKTKVNNEGNKYNYYVIKFERKGSKRYEKMFRKDKYTLEDVIKFRDEKLKDLF